MLAKSNTLRGALNNIQCPIFLSAGNFTIARVRVSPMSMLTCSGYLWCCVEFVCVVVVVGSV